MREFLRAQFQNIFLWTPFLMAFGAALYFSLPFEPSIAYPILISILCAACAFVLRKYFFLLSFFFCLLFGLFYACGFTRLIDTPQIYRTLRNIDVSGTVSDIDYTDNKSRVFVKVPADILNKNLPANRLATIRVSLDEGIAPPKIGDHIIAQTTLFKPDGPSAPGGFDYARWAYFNGITATGYLNFHLGNDVGKNEEGRASKSRDINSLRDYMHQKANSFLSDTLVLGYNNAIPKDDAPIWKATGISHVWSISGFHMTLVSGWLFALFYCIFRLIAPISRRIPARQPAIICAWAGLLFYLFLSGAGIATVRAFLMATLVFGALLFSRNGLSIRNICLALSALFLANPHFVMQPGFQLSFAAVFGLIWHFQDGGYKKLSFLNKVIRIIKAAAMTSIIATIFTAPFIAYHFYSMPLYGLLGNLILLPVFSIAVMPLVMIGTLTALFDFTLPLIWCADIYNWALTLADKIARLPFAMLQTPHVSGMALCVITLGFLCLMFIKNTGKLKINVLLFCILMTLGISIVALAPRPIFYTTYDNELIGFVHGDKLKFNKAKASNHYFAFDTWKQLNFEAPGTPNKRFKCGRGVCKFQTQKWNLVYIQKYVPLSKNIAELCRDRNIDFIVSYFRTEAPNCHAKILRGAFVIYKSGRVEYSPSNRWWHNSHKIN